jgi:hypothetical protein
LQLGLQFIASFLPRAEPAMDAQDRTEDCASRCRFLADETYRLADVAEQPYVINEYLKIAARLSACADSADRGEVYAWPEPEY